MAELVRLPAVLSVPGDVLLGAAASGQVRDVPRTAGLAAASSCLYLAGMALNDYADREVDARRAPARPIPSGRVTPGFALGLAGGLTAGRRGSPSPPTARARSRSLRRSPPRSGPTTWCSRRRRPARPGCRPAAPSTSCSAPAPRAPRALPAAAVVAAHTAVVTEVSRREVEGGDAVGRPPRAGRDRGRRRRGRAAVRRAPGSRRAAALGLLGAYAAVVGRAHAEAVRDPSPERMQRAVGAGILGLMPLEAGLLAGAGALAPAAGVAALWPVARSLPRRSGR